MENEGRDVIAGRSPSPRQRWRGWRIFPERLGLLRRASASRSIPEEQPGPRTPEGPSGHPQSDACPIPSPSPAHEPPEEAADRAGGVHIPSCHSFRVLFVVRPGVADAACMRYRAFNIIEALGQSGIEAAHIDDRQIPQRLSYALGFDLIVLVRRQMSPEISMLLNAARRHAVPILNDLDDYLFHEEVIPFVEMYRSATIEEARRSIARWRDVILSCDGFTTTTPHLLDRAARLGKRCYLIRNGLNSAQLELSRMALDESQRAPRGDGLRLGYFSGTRTHQDDFRLVADVLVRILEEFPQVSLTVAGDFDLDEFAGFARFAGRVESRPFVDWRLLPSEIVRVDINLIPLRTNLFTEAKSNLKYYEAGLLRIPSVASPTEVFTSSITHGANGLLARDDGEWYAALRSLIVDPDLRRRLGDRAHEHVLKTYVPAVVASEALSAYRDLILTHRRNMGVGDDTPTVVMLLSDLARAVRDRDSAVALGMGLRRAGALVTLLLPKSTDQLTAAGAIQLLAEHYPGPTPAVQVGGDIPCCDLLLATDPATAHRTRQFAHRARKAAYFLSESSPAPTPLAAPTERATIPWASGLTPVVADAGAADLLGIRGPERPFVMPAWVGRAPAPLAISHRPGSVLVAAVPGQPSRALGQAAEALRQVHAAHPELRLVLCGDAADLEIPDLPHQRLPGFSGEEFELALAERPICLALSSWVRPAWISDLMAAGCPVICAPWPVDRRDQNTELSEGLLTVPVEAGALAGAIDSLLFDPVRLSALMQRAAAQVREMTDAAEAARILINILHDPDSRAAGHHDNSEGSGTLSVLSFAS